ncbi:PorP/SprF family type IX secretion system membrane protein [Thermophagus xiamenensis]|uniref:Type IX secretion system membrane protein, PorP/SprF family n=1 Tax=Thermophagus xiamenensis TaxID=385682 RepID=A0A1I1UAH9_9BACT|nr:PorP/SprF family type IX secretion system membrane protein [Thermophagus xiamenensis]SFD67871.1 type IX secretion system membrane protein, PorP/SprF family [Thermophagus xiamenensis]
MKNFFQKAYCLIGIILIMTVKTKAQDLHFSQFYASPLYLSPSLAGATDGARLAMNYRNQWPGIEKAFTTYAVSFDNYFNAFNSGLGVQLIQDKAGTAGLTTTQAAFQYSYNIQISNFWQVVPAIQFAYGNRSINFSKLRFADEEIGGGASGSWDQLSNDQAQYVDFASSVLFYSPLMWVGVTIDHLTKPNYSFLGEKMQLPLKFVFYGGINIWTERRRRKMESKTFAATYRIQRQKDFNQADIGAYWFNDPLEIGVWYRGLPLFKSEPENKINQDAIVVSLSYRHGSIRFGYSYDITISGLGWNSAGAHELSLIYEFNQNLRLRNRGRRPAVPCQDYSNPLIKQDYTGKYRKKNKRIF